MLHNSCHQASQPPPQQHHNATVNSNTVKATAKLAISHHLILLLHSPIPRHLHCSANEQWRTFSLCIGPDNAVLDQKWLGRVWPNLFLKLLDRCKSGIKIPGFIEKYCKNARLKKMNSFLCIRPSLKKKIISHFHMKKILKYMF